MGLSVPNCSHASFSCSVHLEGLCWKAGSMSINWSCLKRDRRNRIALLYASSQSCSASGPLAVLGEVTLQLRGLRRAIWGRENVPTFLQPGGARFSRPSGPFPCASEGKDFVLEADDPGWVSLCCWSALGPLTGLWLWPLTRNTDEKMERANHHLFITGLTSQGCSYAHFTDEEVEAQRG